MAALDAGCNRNTGWIVWGDAMQIAKMRAVGLTAEEVARALWARVHPSVRRFHRRRLHLASAAPRVLGLDLCFGGDDLDSWDALDHHTLHPPLRHEMGTPGPVRLPCFHAE